MSDNTTGYINLALVAIGIARSFWDRAHANETIPAELTDAYWISKFESDTATLQAHVDQLKLKYGLADIPPVA
jgi:hypothetical protein